MIGIMALRQSYERWDDESTAAVPRSAPERLLWATGNGTLRLCSFTFGMDEEGSL